MSIEQLEEKIQNKQFLVFLLDGKNYGFPILKVDGIIGLPVITPIPKTPEFVKGVINLRGQIIPVIDLRLTLGMPQFEYNEQSCIIVVKVFIKNKEKFIGFIVDIVSEVFDIPVSDIEAPPDYGTGIEENFLDGIGKQKDKIVMLLNLEKIVNTQETASFIDSNMHELDALVLE